MKNFDTFEANLVMSTLSPEDEEYERETRRSQYKSQNANIDLDRTAIEPEKHNSNESGSSTSSSMSLRKRNFPKAGELTSSELSVERNNSLEIIRKKRRTSVQSIQLPAKDIQTTENATNMESEELQVIFQEESNEMAPIQSESMAWEENVPILAKPNNKRDHRPFVREIFKTCFTQNDDRSRNLGNILVECSDEE